MVCTLALRSHQQSHFQCDVYMSSLFVFICVTINILDCYIYLNNIYRPKVVVHSPELESDNKETYFILLLCVYTALSFCMPVLP